MIGMRMIPGVGWAATAYAVADMGSRAFLGKPFGETMVGKPIDWAVDKAGRAGMAAATGAMDLVGWKGGSDFLRNTVYPWAYPSETASPNETALSAEERTERRIIDARASGLLPKDTATPILFRGPAQDMSKADTTVATPTIALDTLPLKAGQVDLGALAMAGAIRSPALPAPEIEARRAELLASDHAKVAAPERSAALDISTVDGRRHTNLADAISAEAAVKPTIAVSQVSSPTKPMGRGYDD